MISYLEEFFVNGITMERSLNLFLGSTSKETSLSTLRAYYGRLQANLPWTEIRELIRAMFTEGEEISIRKRHFYGNDGVCLFKFMVNANDPQKGYVGFVLGLNVTCFAIISVAYILVGVTTKRSSKGVVGNGNENLAVRMRKRNQALQTKIAMIIGTDFACWSPFIVVSILNVCEVVDLSAWYGFLSIVFLPINGIINPLLYNSSLSGPAQLDIMKAITDLYKSLKQIAIGCFSSSSQEPTDQTTATTDQPATTDEVAAAIDRDTSAIDTATDETSASDHGTSASVLKTTSL
eukprot:sb/3467597/